MKTQAPNFEAVFAKITPKKRREKHVDSALNYWDYGHDSLKKQGVENVDMLQTLRVYAIACAQIDSDLPGILAEGMTCLSAKGNKFANLGYSMMMKQVDLALKCEKDLGLLPKISLDVTSRIEDSVPEQAKQYLSPKT